MTHHQSSIKRGADHDFPLFSPRGGAYCLQAKVFHTDGTKKNYKICFAKRTHGWQRRRKTFTIAKDYKKIVVFLRYVKQGGEAWFDDVRLIKN